MEQHRENRVGMQPRPNLAYLVELSDGDEQFIIEVLTMFVNDAPELLKQCVGYHKTDNFHLLKITVHKIKSSIKMLGNDGLAKSAQQIEDASQDDTKHDAIGKMLPPFVRDVHKFIEVVQAEIDLRTKAANG